MGISKDSARGASLGAGEVVGGRFVVESREGWSIVGDLYRAKDRKTKRRVYLHLLGPTLYGTPEAHELLRQAVRVASSLAHRNVAATFGMGTEPGGFRYVAAEFIDGQRLSDLVASRRTAGKVLSLRAAYNVVAHVLNALTYAQATTIHAALTPTSVLVNKSGRVKVAGFGLLTALLPAERTRLLAGRGETSYLAPELGRGDAADVRADVFGAAAVLWFLLSGRAPGERPQRPSQERADLPPALDALLVKALAEDPADRPPHAATFKASLQEIVRAVADQAEPDIDVELDVEVASLEPEDLEPVDDAAPAVPRPAARKSTPPPPPKDAGKSAGTEAPAAPKVGDRVSLDGTFRESSPPPPGRPSKVDFDSLLETISSQDAERWMVQKDKLDHGPFSARTLIQQVLQGKVSENDPLLNMDTGERRKLKAWPEFKEFVVRYKKKKAEEEKQKAIAVSGRAEKRSNVVKYLIAAAVVVVVGGGVTGFFLTRQAGRDRPRTPDELADLFQPGQIEIKGTAGILPMPRRSGRGGRRRGGRGGGGGGGVAEGVPPTRTR